MKICPHCKSDNYGMIDESRCVCLTCNGFFNKEELMEGVE